MPWLRSLAAVPALAVVAAGCVSPAEKERIVRAEIARAQAAKEAGAGRRLATARLPADRPSPPPALVRPATQAPRPPAPAASPQPQPAVTRAGQVILSATSYIVLDECRIMMVARNGTGGRLRDMAIVAEVVAGQMSYPAAFSFPLVSAALEQSSFAYIPLPACLAPLRIEVAGSRACWVGENRIDDCTGLLGSERTSGDVAGGVRPVDISLPAEPPLPRRQPAPAG